MSVRVAPSILSADFARLGEEIQMINESEANWLHLDIMDGVFVPNISFGFGIVETINNYAKKPLDVHLMIVEPGKYIENFREAGADNITIHLEACTHLHRNIQQIKASGASAGVAINPHTPVAALHDIIQDLDLICLMSVNPGFGGQKFIAHTFKKIEELKKLIRDSGSKALIEIDGGVTVSNSRSLIEAGVDVLVAGSSVFLAENPQEAIIALKSLSQKTVRA